MTDYKNEENAVFTPTVVYTPTHTGDFQTMPAKPEATKQEFTEEYVKDLKLRFENIEAHLKQMTGWLKSLGYRKE